MSTTQGHQAVSRLLVCIGLIILLLGAVHPVFCQGQWWDPFEMRLGPAPVLTQPDAALFFHPPPPRQGGLSVDTQNRSAVVDFFDTYYTPALSVPINWTGSIAGCVAGATSTAYLDATLQMVNYYRAMTELPGDVGNVTSLNDDSQEAALMMIAEPGLSHTPDPDWVCYTSDGAAAAGNSNLALGNAGPSAIVAYVRDSGAGNYDVGHRRWILYPPQAGMATGSNNAANIYHGANDLYVFASFGARPAAPSVVAWPPPAYVPYQVIYDRWSMSLNSAPSASYASATVTMTLDGSNVPLTVVSWEAPYGDTTIVLEPSGLSFGAGQPDQTVTVTVDGISDSPLVSYDVIVIDPALTPDTIFEDGFELGNTNVWSDVTP